VDAGVTAARGPRKDSDGEGRPAQGSGNAAVATLTPTPDDSALGHALKAGEPSGAEGLFQRYGQHIHDFVQRLVHDPSTADDITQTTFVRAIERGAELRDPRRVRSWLYGIAVNLARDHLTKNPALRQAEIPDTVTSTEDDPEETTERHVTEALVWSAVASMELHQRLALDLAVRHDLSSRDIAAALHMTPARASLTITRARSSFRHALRSLLVAQSRTHCDRLAELVPDDVRQLSTGQRRSVEHHMKHCAVCQSRAAVLTSPMELLGGIALLPLPAALGHGWFPHAVPMPPTHQAAAHFGWTARLRSPAGLAGGAITLLLFGGGIAILHGSHRPAIGATQPHPAASLTPAADIVATTPPAPTASPTPSAAEEWAAALAMMRDARGYHVTYSGLNAFPDKAPPADPLRFDLRVQPSGDFDGTYFASDGFIGQFDIRRVGGVLAVRHLNLGGNFGVAGAPETAAQFFGLTSDQASALGESWLPLTGTAQRSAAAALMTRLSPYVTPSTLADVVLAPPPVLTIEPGLDVGSTLLRSPDRTLTFRLTPYPFIDFTTSLAEVRVDNFGR
jgi:RNA polymerase sigma factor (sigma-70 family)